MATTTMNISLPDTLRQYIEERVSQGGYGNVSEYIRELVRLDQKQKAEATLEAMLLAGLNSGEAVPLTEDDMAAVRRTVRERIAARKK